MCGPPYVVATSDGETHEFEDPEDALALIDEQGPEVVSHNLGDSIDEPTERTRYAVLIQWLPAQEIVFYESESEDDVRERAERDHPGSTISGVYFSKVGLVVPIPS